MYKINGAQVSDASRVLPNGEGIKREITAQGATSGMYARLASAKQIVKVSDALYAIDDKAYQIRLDDVVIPVIRLSAEGQELVVPFKGKLIYSIIF